MIDRIAIDVTNTEQSAVPKEKFRINKYNFGTPTPKSPSGWCLNCMYAE